MSIFTMTCHNESVPVFKQVRDEIHTVTVFKQGREEIHIIRNVNGNNQDRIGCNENVTIGNRTFGLYTHYTTLHGMMRKGKEKHLDLR